MTYDNLWLVLKQMVKSETSYHCVEDIEILAMNMNILLIEVKKCIVYEKYGHKYKSLMSFADMET